MKLFSALLCFSIISPTVSFAVEAQKAPLELQCSGSNGLFLDRYPTGAAFYLKDADLRVNMASPEGQLIAYESGKPISNIESVTVLIPFRQCRAEMTKDLGPIRFRAMWCYRSEDGELRFSDEPSPPLKVLINKKDGTTVSFENLNYKFTLTHASINDTSSYSSQNSIELNVSDKRTHDEKVARQESFVIFKGNNLRCR